MRIHDRVAITSSKPHHIPLKNWIKLNAATKTTLLLDNKLKFTKPYWTVQIQHTYKLYVTLRFAYNYCTVLCALIGRGNVLLMSIFIYTPQVCHSPLSIN